MSKPFQVKCGDRVYQVVSATYLRPDDAISEYSHPSIRLETRRVENGAPVSTDWHRDRYFVDLRWQRHRAEADKWSPAYGGRVQLACDSRKLEAIDEPEDGDEIRLAVARKLHAQVRKLQSAADELARDADYALSVEVRDEPAFYCAALRKLGVEPVRDIRPARPYVGA